MDVLVQGVSIVSQSIVWLSIMLTPSLVANSAILNDFSRPSPSSDRSAFRGLGALVNVLKT